jgi:hypothetical protein
MGVPGPYLRRRRGGPEGVLSVANVREEQLAGGCDGLFLLGLFLFFLFFFLEFVAY